MKLEAKFFIGVVFLSIGITSSVAQSGWGWSPHVNGTKPGECPASNPNMACLELPTQCKSDCECTKQEKCCPQDTCGNICKSPVSPSVEIQTCEEDIRPTNSKIGTCPPPDPLIRCIQCNDQCRSDCECPGQQKCCKQPGCGNRCKATTESGTG